MAAEYPPAHWFFFRRGVVYVDLNTAGKVAVAYLTMIADTILYFNKNDMK